MQPVLTQLIDGEQYITRKQIPQYFNITFYDTQRFVKKHLQTVRVVQLGKSFYYSLSDLKKAVQ
jgi:hypothetical protein